MSALLEFAFSNSPLPYVPTLTSTAMTPPQFEAFMQPIVANILGIPAEPYPWGAQGTPQAWSSVRIGWQPQGQPAWKITEDVCILTATTPNDAYARVRDGLFNPTDEAGNLEQNMSFTQIWSLRFVLYGPNCHRNATKIISSLFLDWTHDILAARNVYAVVEWNRPVYAPENFQGQWWARCDFEIKLNELVLESVVIPAAESFDVNLLKENGITAHVHIQRP